MKLITYYDGRLIAEPRRFGWVLVAAIAQWCKISALAVIVVTVGTASVAETVFSRDIYVIDGDTIDHNDNRIRLVGFDTPETYRAQCDYELTLGTAATERLRGLIASGQLLDLVILPGRDKYNRGLARFYVGGNNVADILIGEGLARPYEGGRRQSWC